MSAPDHIYASPDPDDGWRWPRASKLPEQGPHLNVCYRRADLPPPLSAALAVPEVAALVEALRAIADMPDYRLPKPQDIARAALAACDAKTPAND